MVSGLHFLRTGLVPFNLFMKSVDGRGQIKQLKKSKNNQYPYSWAPDGKRFLLVKGSKKLSKHTQLNIVLNWFEELK